MKNLTQNFICARFFYLTHLLFLYILFIYRWKEWTEQLNIIIKNSSSHPIYEQIYTQIKDLILNGSLKEGDPLPSIRGLAKDLCISVITTKRAYDELEREGYINTVGGKGCFVAGMNRELIREENLKKIEEHLLAIQKLAKSCSITRDELLEMLQILEVEE